MVGSHGPGSETEVNTSALMTDFKVITFTFSYLDRSCTEAQSGTNHLYVSLTHIGFPWEGEVYFVESASGHVRNTETPVLSVCMLSLPKRTGVAGGWTEREAGKKGGLTRGWSSPLQRPFRWDLPS